MPHSDLVFGVNDNGFVVLGKNDYDYFNDTTVMNLLKNYKKVQFDNSYNSNIDWLPEGITDVNLGMNFNQPLDNLPHTVKRIRNSKYNNVGLCGFNQSLDFLPIGLEELIIEFSIVFNHPINNLPPGLKKLHLYSQEFNNTLNNLPDSLEYIYIRTFDYNNTQKLPSQLKTIKIVEYRRNVEDLTNMEYQGLRTLQNNYPNVEFIYKD